jgi:serine/threonine protein kinase
MLSPMSDSPSPIVVAPATHQDPLVGQTLSGRFRILSLIDRGGMGKIYKAEQQPLGRIVALKTLDVHDTTGEFKKRFFLEASVCAKLSHPNTVRIFDYGRHPDDGPEAGAVYYLVMEFLEGIQLQQLVHDGKPLEPLRAIRIARQICGALAEAHDQGIVHRDLKPQNVFLTKHGEDGEFVKVVDFGLVKELGLDSDVSRSGNVLGSPMYMSPEQVESLGIDQRTDIYALGLILYVLFTGQTPYKKGNALSVMMQQVHKEVPAFKEIAPNLKLPPSIEFIVRTCVMKAKEDRFLSMREVLKGLKIAERQVRGDIPDFQLKVDKGALVLPNDVELSEEVRLPDPRRLEHSETSQSMSIVQTMTRPAPIAAGLLGLVLLGSAAVGLAVLIAAIAATFVLTPAVPPPAPPPPVAVEAVVATPEVPPTPVETPPATPMTHDVALTSDPSGAELSEDGAVIGNTPMTITVTEGSPRTIALAASGRQGKTVRLDGTQPALAVTLPKTASTVPKPPTTTPPVTPPTTPTTTTTDGPKKTSDVRNPFGN